MTDTMTSNPDDTLQQLSDAGVSVWLDDISRDRLRTGNLEALIRDMHVVGVTSNPTIFAHALSSGTAPPTTGPRNAAAFAMTSATYQSAWL